MYIKKKSHKQRQAEWIKQNQLRAGDKVIITRRLAEEDQPWGNVWAEEMDETIGVIGEVFNIRTDNIGVRFGGSVRNWWNYPYFCLCKVKEDATSVKAAPTTTPTEETVTTLKPGLYRIDGGSVADPAPVKLVKGMAVLVRDDEDEDWKVEVYSHHDGMPILPYYDASGASWEYCIPYTGNEHLCGTSKPAVVQGVV